MKTQIAIFALIAPVLSCLADADPDDVVLAEPLHWLAVQAPAGTHIKVIRRTYGYVTFQCDEFQLEVPNADFNALVEQTEKSRKAGENGTKQFEAQVEEFRQKAYQLYPDLRDPNSDLYKLRQSRVQGYMERLPEVFNSPSWPLTVAKDAAEIVQFQQRTAAARMPRKQEKGALTKEQIVRLRRSLADTASDRKRNPDARGAYYQDEQGNVYRDGVLIPRSHDLIIDGRVLELILSLDGGMPEVCARIRAERSPHDHEGLIC